MAWYQRLNYRVLLVWIVVFAFLVVAHRLNQAVALGLLLGLELVVIVIYRRRLFGSVIYGFRRAGGSEILDFEIHTKVARLSVWAGLLIGLIGLAASVIPVLPLLLGVTSWAAVSSVTMPFEERGESKR